MSSASRVSVLIASLIGGQNACGMPEAETPPMAHVAVDVLYEHVQTKLRELEKKSSNGTASTIAEVRGLLELYEEYKAGKQPKQVAIDALEQAVKIIKSLTK